MPFCAHTGAYVPELPPHIAMVTVRPPERRTDPPEAPEPFDTELWRPVGRPDMHYHGSILLGVVQRFTTPGRRHSAWGAVPLHRGAGIDHPSGVRFETEGEARAWLGRDWMRG